MSTFSRLQSTQVSPKTAGIAIVALLVLCSLGIYGAKRAANGSTPAAPAPTAHATATATDNGNGASVDVSEKDSAKDKDQGKKIADSAEVEDPCKIIAERNMFKPVSADSTDSGSAQTTGRRSSRGGLAPMSVGNLPVLPGFGGVDMALSPQRGGNTRSGVNLAYTGLVDVPSGPLALIENITTCEAKYVGVGDSAFGMRVVSVSPRSVSLDGGSGSVRLAIGENKPETAVTTTAANAAARRGQPQQSGTQAAGAPSTAQSQPVQIDAAQLASLLRASSQSSRQFSRRNMRSSSGQRQSSSRGQQ